MTFFNKKEEVIDLELTPYGESLLSAGKFKPTYYAFFDDDILYDASGSCGIIETQNTIETRIQTDTPNLRPQYLYSGAETNLEPMIEFDRNRLLRQYLFVNFGIDPDDYAFFPPIIDRDYSFVEPIGNMELGSEYVPSWDIKVLDGELSAAINYMTSSTESSIYNNVHRIPQLDFDLNYKAVVGSSTRMDINGPIRDRIISPIYGDGTFVYLVEERPQLIFDIGEKNAPVGTEYDIELFEVLPNDIFGNKQMRRLNFQKKAQRVVNNILIDEVYPTPQTKLSPKDAEYFFQINVDLEIPEEEICPKIVDARSKGAFINDIPYNCPDVRKVDRFDIYRTNAIDGDVEICNDD
jgi:hypothetical protein